MVSRLNRSSFLPPPIPTIPYSKQRKPQKPHKDTLTDRHHRYNREKNIWKSIFSYLLQNNRTLRRLSMYLWRQSIKGANISIQQMHQIKIPKFFIKEHQAACADELAEKIETILQKESISSIAAISIIPFPKLHYSPDAEAKVRDALSVKIKQTKEIEKITFGWGKDNKDPSKADPQISKHFIDACIKKEPIHNELTLESLPENKGDLARLIKSFKLTKTLRLSTTIESEMTKDFIDALPNLQTIIFQKPAGRAFSKLQESTWDRFNDYLKKTDLKVELDNVARPTKERPWMEKLKKVKLDLRKSTDPKVRVDLKKRQ